MYRFWSTVGILVASAALLASCTGGGAPSQQGLVPSAGALSGSAHYARGTSWILPDAKKSDLLYISDLIGQVVDIYTYGKGYKLVGQLTGFFNPEGLCVDKKGDVYVTNTTNVGGYEIIEYAHGGTSPMRTLNDPDGRPNGCSVDPTTGNLAVADFWGHSETIGNVAVFPKGTGSPTPYSNSNIYYDYYCAYDDKGNLFVDGETEGSVFGLGELSKGGSTLNFINIDQTIYLPGGVMWDGKYLAVGDQVAVKHNFTSTIYQMSINGSQATTVSTMILTGSNEVAQFWIPRIHDGGKREYGDRLIGPNQDGKDTLFWDYPSGGDPIATISGESDPIGVTLSLAKK
jgi:hypothetical protein